MSRYKFSRQLSSWLRSKERKTLGHLQIKFGSKGFAVAFLLLMSLAALPLPTGGITHVLEVITMLLALELIVGLHAIWLPDWAQKRTIGEILTKKALPKLMHVIERLERMSRHRLSVLFMQPWFLRITGLFVFVFAMAALLAPPFSGLDTLPGLGVVFIALGWLFEDSAIYGAGVLFGSIGVTINLTIGDAIFHFIFK